MSTGALLDHARSDEGRKQLRYAGVSLVFVPLGQVLIQVLGSTVYSSYESKFTWASITSAAILTLPNFFANKWFVWRQKSRDKLRTQILVFWVAAVLGVILATTLTWFVEIQFDGKDETILENLAVFAAQLTGFGVVWIGRYIILDRWLFKVTHHGEEPDEDDLEMLHGDLPV
jgi:putative flippase GtrA